MEKDIVQTLTPARLAECAARFNTSPDELEPISQVENFIYQAGAGKASFILRITHHDHRTQEEIQGELAWISHLDTHGLRVPQPIPSINQRLVEVVEAQDTAFLVTAFHKLPGQNILDAGQCTPEMYHKWGRWGKCTPWPRTIPRQNKQACVPPGIRMTSSSTPIGTSPKSQPPCSGFKPWLRSFTNFPRPGTHLA